ncbi:MAG TPA: hypothetical protein VLL54_06360 [Pyrinomonadaceae bacterium]|nr:hypothetical protein [Pyrinomonadaceae bacterium]
MNEDFEVIGNIEGITIIAVGGSIREIHRLRKVFGQGRWRKLKGKATVKLEDGTIHLVELHWYEAHGIGRKKLKIKRYLDYDE